MNDKRLQNLFDQIKNERRGGAPRDAWVSQSRELLMMQVRNTTDTKAKTSPLQMVHHLFDIFVPKESIYSAARGVAMFMLVVGAVLGGGLASASFYGDTVPGDNLYGVKVAVEKTELFLAPNEDYRTKLHAEFADHRMEETASLSEGNPIYYSYIPALLEDFSGEVESLSSGIGSSEDTEFAKSLERRMSEYQLTLRKTAAILPGSYRPSIDEARSLVNGVSIKAMAIIVESHRRGSDQATDLVVATKLGEHLKQVEDKIETAENIEPTVAPRTEKARAAIAEAKELVTEGKYEAALSKIVEVAELTKDVKELEDIAPATVSGEGGGEEVDSGEGLVPTESDPAATGVENDSGTVEE